ncbi:HAMP domain-containing histidine kinase [Oscillospiraceae bacterium OttesenSCG-928-G22]|nr:HAMP domain-containing histidine kinase [Oscillospiraceae bacterium OttesenSCG-928-G22]
MLETLKSNFRFSLSLRIALRYSLFLLRSLVPVLLIFTIAFLFAISPAYVGDIRRTIELYEAGEFTAPPDRVALRVTENDTVVYDTLPCDFFFFTVDGGRPLFRIDWTRNGRTFSFALDVSPYLTAYWILGGTTAGIVFLLIFRILRRRKALAASVLAPIEEMTESARQLSAKNLDMRINLLGTKNELRDLASVINDMLDRIEGAYESQKAFVSDASHELRTPIAVIEGYASLLARWGMDDPDVAKEAVDAIKSESENMNDLLEKLLFLARHDKKTLRLELEAVPLTGLLEELTREARLIAPDHNINFLPGDDVAVTADRGAVKQALRVFLDNAIKYTPPGGDITFSLDDLGDEARISVCDTGPGMTRDEAVRAFDRFYRAEGARASGVKGHGLGLSMARIIAGAHGGRIAVKTAPGEGSTFRLILKKYPPLV